MNLLFPPAAAALFALALVVPALGAELMFPPGSRIGLVPPPGMSPSARLQGFEDRERGAVIAITELSGQTYPRMAQEFGPESMRAQGMEVLGREELSLPGGPALIVAARQQADASRKWALLALVGDITVVIVVLVPDAVKDVYPDAVVRAALHSVSVRGRLSADEMLAVLSYRLNDLGGFHLMRATADGTAVLTLGPNDTPLPAEQPYFLVAPRAADIPPEPERDAFARRALALLGGRGPDRIVSSEPLRVAGAQGHQIIAEAKDERTGDDLMIVQWLRFGTGGFVQMFGIARKDAWADAFPRMRAVRDGFAVK